MRYPIFNSYIWQAFLTESFMVIAILFMMSGFVATIGYGVYGLVAVTDGSTQVRIIKHLQPQVHFTQGATIDEGWTYDNSKHWNESTREER